MPAGRPKEADARTLYSLADTFYWDFRRILEGHFRWKHDEQEYRKLAAEINSQEIELSDDQKLALARALRNQVQEGRLREEDRLTRLRELGAENLRVTREWMHDEAAKQARKQIPVPGKPEVIKALLGASTPEEVQTICKGAFAPRIIQMEPGVTREAMMPNWPIPVGSVLPRYLSEFASEFLAAKSDRRFPKSTKRPTSALKQLWFLSRALAGALYGVSTRTAINLVGSKRPEKIFDESRAAKSLRKRGRYRKRIGN